MFHVLLHVPGGRRSFLRRGALLVAAALALSYATFAFVPRIVKALANQWFLTSGQQVFRRRAHAMSKSSGRLLRSLNAFGCMVLHGESLL